MTSNVEMPCYRSHKTVRALKIVRVLGVTGKPNSRILVPEDVNYDNVGVDHNFVAKHKPFAGGYFIVYKDGYQSFSPAQAFEDGYHLWTADQTDDCEGSDREGELRLDPSPGTLNPQMKSVIDSCPDADALLEGLAKMSDPGGNPIDPTTIDPDELQ